MTITVIDYKAGNLTSVIKALDALGCTAEVTADPDLVRRATQVILPGVGHFQATQLLEDTGLAAAVSDSIARGVGFLGICVGLQWLFEGSTEAPRRSSSPPLSANPSAARRSGKAWFTSST